MNNEVIISIVGAQALADDNSQGDQIELITEGKYYKKGDKHYLSYTETEMTGFDNDTTTTLKIDGDTVSITRFGNTNSHMIFKQGQRHVGHYETPYGSFTIGIVPDDVKVNIGETTGDIRIKYMLDVDNSAKAHHDLQLNIREA